MAFNPIGVGINDRPSDQHAKIICKYSTETTLVINK